MINPHQLLVHFPVALLLAGLAVAAWGVVTRSEFGFRLAWINHLLGTFGAVAAALTGGFAEHDAQKLGVPHALIERHEFLGYLTAVYWVIYVIVVGIWIKPIPPAGSRRALVLGLQAAGAVLVALAGHRGSQIVEAMVYR